MIALGRGQEGRAQEHAVRRIAQADQHLAVRGQSAAARQWANPLPVKHKTIVLDGLANALHPVDLALAARHIQVIGLVGVYAVAPFFLGDAAGHVGRPEHVVHVAAVGRHVHHTDAGTDIDGAVFPDEAEVVHGAAQALGDFGGFFRRTILQQHGKLVATHARQHVLSAHAPADQDAELFEQFVAGQVPAGVVDRLEQIEIHVQQGPDPVGQPAGVQILLRAVFKFAAVEHARHRVVRGLVHQLAAEGAHVGDVAEHHHRTDRLPLLVPYRRGAVLDGVFMAAAGQQHDIPRIGDRGAHRRGNGHGILGRFARGVVENPEDLRQRSAGGHLARPAGQPLGHRIHVFHAPAGVGADDRLGQ